MATLKQFRERLRDGRKLQNYSFATEEPVEPPSPESRTFSAIRAGLPEVLQDERQRNEAFRAILPIVKRYTENE